MTQVDDTKGSNEPNSAELLAVRYGYLAFVGEFEYRGNESFIPEAPVLVESDRGLELGHFVCYMTPVKKGFYVARTRINEYLENSGSNYLHQRAGKAVRLATPDDLREDEHIHADTGEKKRFCTETAKRFGLNMKIICVEHLFGGERIIFYFTAEGRIDFRDLVRDLAREYQTRIELRQIGARDEARLLADYEICGRQCCCKNFLKTLRPVNMKMAKLQKATLDPSKVSGRCGRLRCCLVYEHKAYEELVGLLPKVGTYVQTAHGVGQVRDRQIMTQLVQVVLEDGRMIAFPVEELSPAQPPQSDPGADPDNDEKVTTVEPSGNDPDVTDLNRDCNPSQSPPAANGNPNRRRGRRGRRSRRKR